MVHRSLIHRVGVDRRPVVPVVRPVVTVVVVAVMVVMAVMTVVVVMAVVVVRTVMAVRTVMTVVRTVMAVMTAAVVTAAVMAAAVTTTVAAGFSTRGERRQADNDRCGKGEKCSALEHFLGSLNLLAQGSSPEPCLFVAQSMAGDCVGHHTIVESEPHGRRLR